MVSAFRNRQRILGGNKMRIIHQDGKLFVSATRKEVKDMYNNIGSPTEIDIGNLTVLLEDITEAQISYSRTQRIEADLDKLKK